MTAPSTLPAGATLARKYLIRKVLGTGGMGVVYLAENVDIGRQVAIKILHPHASRDANIVARFRQEARASATIDHPGVVDVLDIGETESGEPFIVMERLEGETLSTRLRQRIRLSVGEAVSVITEVLDAIAAAHARGIVHRDLKPDNIFLVWRPAWGVKIVDFGISRFSNADEVRLTESNMVMGTVLYMPPEQARNARSAGPPADIYAIGAVLYHALAGRPPFLGDNYSEVLSRLLTDPHEPVLAYAPETPRKLSALLDEMLAKDPKARPASATRLREQMLALVDVTPPEAPRLRAEPLEATLPASISGLAETAAESGPPAPFPSTMAGSVEGIRPAGRWTRRRIGLVAAAALAVGGWGVVWSVRSSGTASTATGSAAAGSAAVDAAPAVPLDAPSIDAATIPADALELTVAHDAPAARTPDAQRAVRVPRDGGSPPPDAAIAPPADARVGYGTDFVP